LEKIKESHAKLSVGSASEVLKDISFYKQLEDLTKKLKKKSLAVSEWKMSEYDQILDAIEIPKEIKVCSHKHSLKRHPQMHHNGWRCDKIKGIDRCLSGMTDFY